MTEGTSQEHVCPVVGCPGRNSQGQVWVGADVPAAREEAGCFRWVMLQSTVVECCAGVQDLTVRRCFL